MEPQINPFAILGVRVVGLAGQARSGKDSFANALIEAHGSAVRLALADPLRRFIADFTGIPFEELLDGDKKEEVIPWLGSSPRVMMQTIGTDWGRKTVHDEMWLRVAYRQALKAVQGGARLVVIPDVRFPNEADFIRKHMNGMVVKIVRQGLPGAVASHESERALAEVKADKVMVNEASLEVWKAMAHRFAKSLK